MSRAAGKGQYTPVRTRLAPPDRFRLPGKYGLKAPVLPVATMGLDRNHEGQLPSDEGLD